MFAENALLVSLNISQATFRKLDKQATMEVATSHGVQSNVGSYNKSTLPGAVALEMIKKATGNARTYFYKQTLPWAMDGAGILPNKNYLSFTSELRVLKGEWENAVSQFLKDYPTLKASAQQQLNGLYNEKDYPSDPSKLFKFEISFMPIPQQQDFRIELATEEKAKFEATLHDAEKEAQRELYQRMFEVVSKAASTLRNPDGIFRDTLVDNAKELCELMPRLNFNDDPELEAIRAEIESVLANKEPEALRALPSVRKDTVEGLDNILNRMAGYI